MTALFRICAAHSGGLYVKWRNPMSKFATAFFAVIFGGSSALAGTPEQFTAADTNGDGALELAEVQAAMPDVTEDQFRSADADSDGMLNAEEFATLGS